VIFWPLKLALKIIAALMSLLILYLAVTFVQIWLTGREHYQGSAQAIVVFGTAELDGQPSAELTDRLDHALSLWRLGRAPIIAVTGSKRPGDLYTEAGVSATFLEAHGVPAKDIIVGGGTDTWRNVASVAPELVTTHRQSVLIVTDPFHEYRAMSIASDQGLDPHPSPVTTSAVSGSSLWKFYGKETLEVALARIIGYHTLSNWFHVD
jgi:uncharacterized SAM-binding protein YcdF (DUF218 family)